MIATQALAELTRDFDAATGGERPKYGQIAVCVDDDEACARRLAQRFRFAAPGWKVMAELANPVNSSNRGPSCARDFRTDRRSARP